MLGWWKCRPEKYHAEHVFRGEYPLGWSMGGFGRYRRGRLVSSLLAARPRGFGLLEPEAGCPADAVTQGYRPCRDPSSSVIHGPGRRPVRSLGFSLQAAWYGNRQHLFEEPARSLLFRTSLSDGRKQGLDRLCLCRPHGAAADDRSALYRQEQDG